MSRKGAIHRDKQPEKIFPRMVHGQQELWLMSRSMEEHLQRSGDWGVLSPRMVLVIISHLECALSKLEVPGVFWTEGGAIWLSFLKAGLCCLEEGRRQLGNDVNLGETTATEEASDGGRSAWGRGNQMGEPYPGSCLGYFLELDAKQFVDNWNWGWERKVKVNSGVKVSWTVQLEEGNRHFLKWNRLQEEWILRENRSFAPDGWGLLCYVY